MTQIENLHKQAQRAERLARSVLDVVTVTRLLEAARAYRQMAVHLETSSCTVVSRTSAQASGT